MISPGGVNLNKQGQKGGDYIWLRIDTQLLQSGIRLDQMCSVVMSSGATVRLVGVLSQKKMLIKSWFTGTGLFVVLVFSCIIRHIHIHITEAALLMIVINL